MESQLEPKNNSKSTTRNEISDSKNHGADFILPSVNMLKGMDAQITNKTNSSFNRTAHTLQQQEGSVPAGNCHRMDSTKDIQGSLEKDKPITDLKHSSEPMLDEHLTHPVTDQFHSCPCEADIANKNISVKEPKHEIEESRFSQERENILGGLGNHAPNSFQYSERKVNKSARPASKKVSNTKKDIKCPPKVVENSNPKQKNNTNGVASNKSDSDSSKQSRQNLVNFQTPGGAISDLSRPASPSDFPKGSETAGQQTMTDSHKALTSFSEFRAALLGNSIMTPNRESSGLTLPLEDGVVVPTTSSPGGAEGCRNEDVLIVPSLITTSSATVADGGRNKHPMPCHNKGLSSSNTFPLCPCDPHGQSSGPTTHFSSSCIVQSHTSGRPPSGPAAPGNPHISDTPRVAVGTPHGVSSVRNLPPLPKHRGRGKHSPLGAVKINKCAPPTSGTDGVTCLNMLPFLRFSQCWVISSRSLTDHPGVFAEERHPHEILPQRSSPAVGFMNGEEVPPYPLPNDDKVMGGGNVSSSSGVNSVDTEDRVLMNDDINPDSSSGMMELSSLTAAVPRPVQFTLLTDRVDTLLPAWCFLSSYLLASTGDIEQGQVERPPLSHSRLLPEKENNIKGSSIWNPSVISEGTTPLLPKRCFSIYPLTFYQLAPSRVSEDGAGETLTHTLTCGDRIIDANSTCSSRSFNIEYCRKAEYLYYKVRVKICLNVTDHVSSDDPTVRFFTPRETKADMMTVRDPTDHCTSDITTKNHPPLLCPIDSDLRFSRYQNNQEALQLFAESKILSASCLRAQLNDAVLQLIAHAPTVSECMTITSTKGIKSSTSGKDSTSYQTDIGKASSVRSDTSRQNTSVATCESRANIEANLNSISHPIPDQQREEGEIIIKPLGLSVESDVLPMEAALAPLSGLAITFTLTACTTASLMTENCCESTNTTENHVREDNGVHISKSRLVYRTLVDVFPETFVISPHTSKVEFAMCSVCKPTLSSLNSGVVTSESDVDFPFLQVKEWKDLSLEELRMHCILRTKQISIDVTHPHSENVKPLNVEVACHLDEGSNVKDVQEDHQVDSSEPHGEVVLDMEDIKEEANQVDTNQFTEANEIPTPEVMPVEEKCDFCSDLSSCSTEPDRSNISTEHQKTPQKCHEVNSTDNDDEVNSRQDTAMEASNREKSMEEESKEEQMEWDMRDMTAKLTEKTQEVCREAEQIDLVIKSYHKLYDIPAQLSDKMNFMFDMHRVPRPGDARRISPSLTSSTRRGKRFLVDTETAKREAELNSVLINSLIAQHAALFTVKSIEEEGKNTYKDPNRDPHAFFSEHYGRSLSSLITVAHTLMWESVTKSVKSTIEGLDDRDQAALLESLFTCLRFSPSSETSFTATWALHHGEPLLRGLRRDLFSLTDHAISHPASLINYPTFTAFSGATNDALSPEGVYVSAANAVVQPQRGAVVGEQVLGAKLCKTGRKSKLHTSRSMFASSNDSRIQKSDELLLLPALRVVATATIGVSGFSSSVHSHISSLSMERESGLLSTDNIPLMGTFRVTFKSLKTLSKAKTKLHKAEESLEHWLTTLHDLRVCLQWNTATLLAGLILPFLSEHMLILWDSWKELCDLHSRCISTYARLNPNTNNTDIFVSNTSCVTDLEALTKSIDASEFSSASSKNVAGEFLSSSHAVDPFEIECVHTAEKQLNTILDPESRGASRESSALLTASLKICTKQKKKNIGTYRQTSNRYFDSSAKTLKNIDVRGSDGVCPPVHERSCLHNGVPALKVLASSEKDSINAANVKNAALKTVLQKQGTRKASSSFKEVDVTTRLVLPFIAIGAIILLALLYI